MFGLIFAFPSGRWERGKSSHYLLGTSLASNKTYLQSHSCEASAQKNSKDLYCIGDCDSGNLSVKIDEKGYKVKFGDRLSLEGDYDFDLDEPITKEITFEDTGYIRGRCIPCPSK